MKTVVPDASVILKWVLPDPEGEWDMANALALRDAVMQGRIIAKVPSLWLCEAGNTLTRRFGKHARVALEALMAFGLDESAASERWLDQVLQLTQHYQVTFYDAAYHALALTEKGVFVTADETYLRKAGKAGAVMALREWSGPE
jgi:predicted nucleic acid-binding protein